MTTVRDPDDKNRQSIQALELRERSYIVELPALKIIKKYKGDVSGFTPSMVRNAITDILALLKS